MVSIREKCCKNKNNNQKKNKNKYDKNVKQRREREEGECMKNGQSSLYGFFNLTLWCDDAHWRLQSLRMEKKFWKRVSYVGHLETMQDDAKELLRILSKTYKNKKKKNTSNNNNNNNIDDDNDDNFLWTKYGQSGWGKYGNESLFASISGVRHATAHITHHGHQQSKIVVGSEGHEQHYEKERQRKTERFAYYYQSAEIERAIEERYAPDYELKILNLTKWNIFP